MRRFGLVSTGTAVVLLVSAAGCTPQPRWESRPVAEPVDTVAPIYTPDGRSVVFVSDAALVPEDTNALEDVYLRDMGTGAMTLVSINAAGTASGNGRTFGFTLSPDATKVAFDSAATDLVAVPVIRYGPNVFVRDLATGMTSVVTVDRTGELGIGGNNPVFSPDGSKILFETYGDDYGPTDTNGLVDLYMRDLVRDTTSLVSTNGAGTDSGNNWSGRGTFTPDGTQVLFHSNANNLGPVDTNAGGEPGTGYGYRDVYLRDLRTQRTSLVSVNAAGTDSGNGESSDAVVSPDGTKVAFHSGATDLAHGVTTSVANIYVRDLSVGTTELASPAASGADGGNDHSRQPLYSPDGSKLVFVSSASNLGPADGNRLTDVYVRDLAADETILVSVNTAGTSGGNAASWFTATGVPSFSPDGTKVAFVTRASDLGPRDTALCSFDPKPYPPQPCDDVYVRDLTARTTALVSGDGTDSLPNTYVSWPVFSPTSNARLVYLRNLTLHEATQVQ
jgi:Tol biopolymer transport system component